MCTGLSSQASVVYWQTEEGERKALYLTKYSHEMLLFLHKNQILDSKHADVLE